MTRRLVLDEIVDPTSARVLVERGPDAQVRSARFDLEGLPRVESLLVGRPVGEVPALVERLCGVCPAAHHLAGVRALEALAGPVGLPAAARLARRLLHHASAVATHGTRFVTTDRQAALALRRLAKAVMTVVGSPGHFPVTAVPGGIAAAVRAETLGPAGELLAPALAAARTLAAREIARGPALGDFEGADVALCDAEGAPDLLGTRLRAVGADGTVLVASAAPQEWNALVAERRPGAPAPRPRLLVRGASKGGYRVGPVAQLRIGAVRTPLAAALQADWRGAGAGALAARAVMAVHSIEAIGELLVRPELLDQELGAPLPPVEQAGEGVGWIDGPRGLLVHHYSVGDDGCLRGAQILTPTAQNEPWLAALLTAVARRLDGAGRTERLAMEDAIREADPCLPCAMAPAGTMGLVVDEIHAGEDDGSTKGR